MCDPRPPTAWSLHPQPPPTAVKMEPEEKKTPKGVPLQFDINTVAKPVRIKIICVLPRPPLWLLPLWFHLASIQRIFSGCLFFFINMVFCISVAFKLELNQSILFVPPSQQTAMTLNERFRILKDQRTTSQNNKGSRFVTVS